MHLRPIMSQLHALGTMHLRPVWLHTACQTSFIKKHCIFKISSLFGGYLQIFTVKRGGQPHGSDQCGYIHLLYRLVFCFTVVRVEPLCRLGCGAIKKRFEYLHQIFHMFKIKIPYHGHGGYPVIHTPVYRGVLP